VKKKLPALVERSIRFPWECQEGEAPALYAIFSAYLSTSPRSVRKAIGAVRGRTPRFRPGHISRAARSWRWVERAAAFDEHVAAEQRAAFDRLRKKAREERLARLEALSVQVRAALPRMRLSTAEPGVVVKALEVLNREEREELLDTAEDRRTRPEYSAPMPDLEACLLPAPEARPLPQKEEPS
jgi:hypothetical protein